MRHEFLGLADLSSGHRMLLEHASVCGCYHCCDTFDQSKIKEWIDRETTALCPMCGVDAVIPLSFSESCKRHELLTKKYKKWFGYNTKDSTAD